MPRHGGAAPSGRHRYSWRNLACEWRGVPSRSKVEGKRLRVVDFRSISDGGGEGNTLWYYQDAHVRKRAERCRYQSVAFRVDTAKAENERVTAVVNRATLHPFYFPLNFFV